MKRIISCILLTIILPVEFSLKADNGYFSDSIVLVHEHRKEHIKSKWDKLIPKQTKLQFAGSMGMFSQSIGWYYGKHKRWETDLFIGYIPSIDGQESHLTTTIKQTYTPWQLNVSDVVSLSPFTTGLYINKIFGDDFWEKQPKRYPDGYYRWALNTRFNIFCGGTINLKLNSLPALENELSFFYEFSTSDLYILSAINNKCIHFWDILGVSLGIRYRFL